MGGVFARGMLRNGYPVYPVTRDISLSETESRIPNPEMVLVAVGENDLASVLSSLPDTWRNRVCLLQNELLPEDWQGLTDPTIISVWFEKKTGKEAKVIIPSPVYGPHSPLIGRALSSLNISTKILQSQAELLFELVLKNVYILTTNIAGLKTGGSVGELWNQHQDFARDIATEVIEIQESLTRSSFDTASLIQAMQTAFDGDPDHQCMGRSAPARLSRAISHADKYGLAVPLLRQLQTIQTVP